MSKDTLDLILLGDDLHRLLNRATLCNVEVKVMAIQDYEGDVRPPQGAQAAIVLYKDGEALTPLFVHIGQSVSVTELLMRGR